MGSGKTKAVESVQRKTSQWEEDDDVLEDFLLFFFPFSTLMQVPVWGFLCEPLLRNSCLTDSDQRDAPVTRACALCSIVALTQTKTPLTFTSSRSPAVLQQGISGGRQEERLHAEVVVRPQLLYSRALHVRTDKYWKSDMAWFALRSHTTSSCSQSHLPHRLIRTYIHTPEAPSLPPNKSCTENTI